MFQAIPTRVSATGAVIPTLRPGGWGIDRNPGVTIAPGVDINRIPRPATMIPPPPHEHPASEMQRQYAQRDITRIYSPPPSAYPPTYPSYPSQAQAQSQSSSRQPRRSATHDERRHRAMERATSPQIYAERPRAGAANVASPGSSSSSKMRSSSQPPGQYRRSTREAVREPMSLAEAAAMGMEKRPLKPICAPFPPDPKRTIKLDVGGHGAVCIKRFLEEPAYRARLKNGNQIVKLADNYTWWQILVGGR